MKALINSFKRTHWLKASAPFLTCLLFLALPSCKKDELNQDSILNMDEMSPLELSKKDKQETITDLDGNVYKTVLIGKQVWMAENLKTTKYKTGSSIDYYTDYIFWQNNTTGAYAWYDNDEASYKDTYGALYNWYAVNTGNLCPAGWHVPTDMEWHTLVLKLDAKAQFSPSGIESDIAGSKLKSTGTLEGGDGLWQSPNPATNKSGFTALPGGDCNPGGQFQFMGPNGCWWSSTEDWNGVLYRAMSYSDGSVRRHPIDKTYGFSVRCLKD